VEGVLHKPTSEMVPKWVQQGKKGKSYFSQMAALFFLWN
jgi:hypothetical protein